MRHGAASDVDAATFLGDDPGLALVTADLSVWRAAHPCCCDGPTCECETRARINQWRAEGFLDGYHGRPARLANYVYLDAYRRGQTHA